MHLTPGAGILVASLQPFAVASLEVLLRSLPPFPIYSLAGAVDGGKGGGEDVSGDCGNAGALRVGVGGLPGVLSTKVRVLLRPEGVEGHPGELGTTSVVSSCVCFRALISAWSASFSAASGPVNDRAEALPWALIGFAMGFNRLCPFRLLDLIR
jgi:hypothetical protein